MYLGTAPRKELVQVTSYRTSTGNLAGELTGKSPYRSRRLPFSTGISIDRVKDEGFTVCSTPPPSFPNVRSNVVVAEV